MFEVIVFIATVFAMIDTDNRTIGNYGARFDHWFGIVSEYIHLNGNAELLLRIARDAQTANNGYIRCHETYERLYYSDNRKVWKENILGIRQSYWYKREVLRDHGLNVVLNVICE